MNRKIVITGATGLIGTRLCKELIERGEKIIIFSRSADKAKALIHGAQNYVTWNYNRNDWQNNLEGTDAVIHLAGENVMAKRWSKEHKQNIFNSRVDSTRALVDAIIKLKNKPKVFISASAVGFYGSSEKAVTEDSPPGNDFLSSVVNAWENETKKLDEYKIRRVNIRTGIVLDRNEGALAQMITPFKYFVGGPLGTGKQWFPWIHIEDVTGIFLHALNNENVHGILNAVSPNPVRMKEFCRLLGKTMNRPSLFKVSGFVLKIFFGEAADVLISGAQVIPEKTIETGYLYKHGNLEDALKEIITS